MTVLHPRQGKIKNKQKNCPLKALPHHSEVSFEDDNWTNGSIGPWIHHYQLQIQECNHPETTHLEKKKREQHYPFDAQGNKNGKYKVADDTKNVVTNDIRGVVIVWSWLCILNELITNSCFMILPKCCFFHFKYYETALSFHVSRNFFLLINLRVIVSRSNLLLAVLTF